MALVLGLMSGTSADGITAALVELSGRGARVRRWVNVPYAKGLRERVLESARLRAPELSRLNAELGEAFAAAGRRLLRGARATLVGSHGQTVWHGADDRPANTLQLGEPSVIAERLGLPVVADFRPRDIAAGGQGAPLVPAFDEFLFARGPLRAVQNIGGIGNVSFVGRGRLWSAFDTGPGNALMDLLVRRASRGRLAMDRDGRLAARGRADERALARMLAHPFFSRRPPKSLDKSVFGESFLRRFLPGGRLEDRLATLARFTAESIALAMRRFAPARPAELVVSGGGALNPTLMRALMRAVAPVPVCCSEKFGLPAQAKEAACFAWLAWRAWNGKRNSAPAATGARGARVLGKIIPS